ncbi:TonB-dependent receptor plug domain-containing protein [Parabacteroides sp. PF5-6]|uniref:TonB-dependent receptor n=1 Tax=Parabacteroides sp. PF5-6 TaxID=1742403 RepID=UPI0024068BD6|nr:TonB-dependent receptor plug domain-containing protein [Parabacteroides sp. PF5-6]MDF9830870.1 iron complex outermembrane receptor protein [Parabacteroides sp. PF5-6]
MKREFSVLAGFLLAFASHTAATEPVDSLKIAKDISLDEVMVTATKATKETPVAYSELSSQQLNSRNDGQGIPYLISLTPSVIMTSDAGTGIGYSGFRIRGTDANRINVTVNGVPVNDAESHTVFWVNMPDFASSVENIQIQRGAGTSTNGSAAFGATVAMQTQKPELKPYAEYQVSAGSFGTVKNMVRGGTGLLNDHFVVDARYSHVRSDGFIRRASADMHSYYLSAAYYADNTLIKFQTFGSNEKTYQAWTGVPSYLLDTDRKYNPCGEYKEDGVTKYYDNQTDNYRQQHYHLMLNQRLGNYWNMNVTLHYTPGEGYYEDYKAGAKYKSYKLPNYIDPEGNEQKKTDLVRRKWLESDFYGGIFGLNYLQENLHATLGGGINRFVCDHFGRVMWMKAANALPQPDYEYYLNTGKKLDYNLYVKANYRLSPTLNAFLDLQYRGIDYTIRGSDDKAGDNVQVDKQWNFFNPKAGLNYQKNGHNAFASFAIANREPNRDNFTEAGPDERPTHETLYDYEAGYSYTHPAFQLGVNLYFMDYNNQLILTGQISEIGEALTSNIKDSYRAGIELTAGAKIADWLHWNGNATFSRNKIKNFTEVIENYDADWNPIEGQEVLRNALGTTNIAFSPEITANSIFDLNWKAFSASFISQYVGRQYMDNTSSKSRSIDPYFIHSLRIGYTFTPAFMKEIALDVTVNNLFNAEYETNGWVYSAMVGGERYTEDGYFTQAGTNAMIRVAFRF